MSKRVMKVGFSIFREFFDEHTLADDFMIFDNLIEVLNPNGNRGAINYDFPIKMDITIIVIGTEGIIKANIGLKEIVLQKNRLAIVFPGQIFQVKEITPDFQGMFLVLQNSFFNPQNYFIEAMNLQKILIQENYLDVPEDLMPEFINIYNLIKDKIQEKDNQYRAKIIQNYCSILFYEACHVYLRQDDKAITKVLSHKEEIFENFIKLVEEHYRDEHNVSFYADKLCLTPKYLSSLVSEVSDKSAADWIKEYLVLEARALLRLGNMTIQQISNELNFANQSHFGRFFKHHTGMSPKEYQRM